jgi:hypothetical protein
MYFIQHLQAVVERRCRRSTIGANFVVPGFWRDEETLGRLTDYTDPYMTQEQARGRVADVPSQVEAV